MLRLLVTVEDLSNHSGLQNGTRCGLANYRSNILAPIVPRITERLIKDSFIAFPRKHDPTNTGQHGGLRQKHVPLV